VESSFAIWVGFLKLLAADNGHPSCRILGAQCPNWEEAGYLPGQRYAIDKAAIFLKNLLTGLSELLPFWTWKPGRPHQWSRMKATPSLMIFLAQNLDLPPP
jgi:hypothetical protein